MFLAPCIDSVHHQVSGTIWLKESVVRRVDKPTIGLAKEGLFIQFLPGDGLPLVFPVPYTFLLYPHTHDVLEKSHLPV